ncbi:MAG: biotin--[acetyl-CoA-carboxylase] ligase [Candidatus Heimdallarchaeota archaeon]|nr:MAG: biotin--[acetyl-CoA-carboxylase] ligase [Candidatus Heimdallarchaeota archaeon]
MPSSIKEIQTTSKLCPKVYRYTELGSTNNIARQIIENEDQIGFAIVAETQTAGQGQGGRFWESPRGGLWISLAIKPSIELPYLGMIPILSAVGIANALETFDIEVMLKWPNDILIPRNLRKVGGILAEGKVTQLSLDYLIIGVGINVNNTIEQFSLPLQEEITTLFEEFQKKINLDNLT